LGTGGLFLRKLRAKVAAEPTGFVWVEKGKLAGSGYPASRGQVEWVYQSGIRSILSLTAEPLPPEFVNGIDIAYGHVPMVDHQPPAVDALERCVSFIREQEAAGRPVLVHCLAGEGRTGCALAAYTIAVRHVGADEALRTIRRAKPQFVERAQEKSVYDYARDSKL
jgi:Swiss Army Knife protein, DSP-PTPase phosphatase domain